MRLEFTSIYLFSCLRRQAFIVRRILRRIATLQKEHTLDNHGEIYQRRVRDCLILAVKTHQSMIRAFSGVISKAGIEFYILYLITIPLCAATLCMALQNPSFGGILPLVTADLMLLFHTVAGQSCLDEQLKVCVTAGLTLYQAFSGLEEKKRER
ncbi:unnamed protein product [Callosobruchus maculatus]|uniref:Odorant receptor n=1 Tax=Callosobruchus maculatus TaxID=64391 RepID=A0A653D693_CALMS|nr:unnamed protein product [Callosobruchus maculatus]